MRSRHFRNISGHRLASTLRRTSLTLVHIYGCCQFLRTRPHGRLVAVPLYPGESLRASVVHSILLHAAVAEQDILDLMYE
jgi:predicted RNA binding protein YcfA (HicA-like mRNA interferase family)